MFEDFKDEKDGGGGEESQFEGAPGEENLVKALLEEIGELGNFLDTLNIPQINLSPEEAMRIKLRLHEDVVRERVREIQSFVNEKNFEGAGFLLDEMKDLLRGFEQEDQKD